MKRFGLVVLLLSAIGFSQTDNLVANQRRVLRIGVLSDVRFIITDPDGRSAGFDRDTGLPTTQIPLSKPGETCSGQSPAGPGAEPCYRQIEIPNPIPGLYRMEVVAPQGGRYGLFWSDEMHGRTSGRKYSQLPIGTGELQVYDLAIGSDSGDDSVRGDFGGSKAQGATDWLLTWGRPNSEEVSLPAGAMGYDVIIAYGATVMPSTFRAHLNDKDASRLFHPTPGGLEAVRVPLSSGRNILKVTVDGAAGSTRASDTKTLQFTVQ